MRRHLISTENTEVTEYQTKQRRRGEGASRDRKRIFSHVMSGLFERNFNWSIESETLLGHTKVESAVRYLGAEIDYALEIA